MYKILILSLVMGLVFAACQPTQKGDIISTNINIINVENGEIARGQDVIINYGIFREILPTGQSTPVTPILVDGTNKFLIPDLWDMHKHTRRKQPFLAKYTYHGITGVRDCSGSFPDVVDEWGKQISARDLAGPEMIISPVLDGHGGNSPYILTPSTNIDSIVKSLKEEGYDFIKVYHHLSMEQLKEIAQAANKYDISFSGYLPFAGHQLRTQISRKVFTHPSTNPPDS